MLSAPSGIRCTTISYDSAHFANHLRQQHQDSLINQNPALLSESMHLGAKAHRRYFCGFCNSLIPQNPTDFLNAAEARYKHIGDHYDQDSRHVNDWICSEANKAKGLLSAEERKRAKASSSSSAARPSWRVVSEDEDEDSDLGESGIPLLLPPQARGGVGLGAAFPYSPAVYGAAGGGAAQGGKLGKRRRMSPDLVADAGSGVGVGM